MTVGGGGDNALSVLDSGGRAVFVSDSSPWADAGEGSDRPITFGSNRLLLQNIVAYIVPEPATLVLLGAFAVAARRARGVGD